MARQAQTHLFFFLALAISGCEGSSGPGTLGGAKTRLESRIEKFTPQFVFCRLGMRLESLADAGGPSACTIPVACYPCLFSSKHHAVCMRKGRVDLIKLLCDQRWR